MRIRDIALSIALALPAAAWASSFFQAEVGLGAAHTKDIGDGTWVQYNVPYTEHLNTPAYLVGATGALYEHNAWSLHYHLDYTYIGTYRASCLCVSDAAYAVHQYSAGRHYFDGSGHTQGISLTLEPGYTYHGYRFAAEAGPWVYWESWHERADLNPTVHVSHRPDTQLGWVAGASVTRGHWSLSYRYYSQHQKWNPYPSLTSGSHVVMLKYVF
jgi:hypothetical protein